MKDKNVKLRYSLRLAHLLQKERGASASHYAYSITHPKENRPDAPLSGIGATLSSEEPYYNDKSQSVSTIAMDSKDNDNQNGGDGHNYRDFFSKAIHRARLNTNVAFSMLDNVDSWVASLERVRNKIDGGIENFCHDTENTVISSHRVVVMYNILIGSIIDECVIRLVQKELQTLKKNYGNELTPSDSDKKFSSTDSIKSSEHLQAFPRHHSQLGLFEIDQLRISGVGVRPGVQRRASSDTPRGMMIGIGLAKSLPIDYADDVILNVNNMNGNHHKPLVMDDEYFSNIYKYEAPHLSGNSASLDKFGTHTMLPIVTKTKNKVQTSSPPLLPPRNSNANATANQSCSQSFQTQEGEYMVPVKSMSRSPDEQRVKASISSAILESPSTLLLQSTRACCDEARNLLMLLLSFVRLKESTGLERAILCSLMALSTEDDDTRHRGQQHAKLSKEDATKTIRHSTSKLLNDLVVEEANQRNIVRELQAQSKNIDHSLLYMVEKSLTPSREMRKVQDMIKDFNLQGLQQSMPLKQFWLIITLYIDQLHALELVIVEELGIWLMELDSNVNVNVNATAKDDADPEDCVSNNELVDNGNGAHTGFENADWQNMADEEVMQNLSKLSAEQVKQLFLQQIHSDNSTKLPLPDLSKDHVNMVDDVMRQLTPSPMMPTSTSESSHSLKEWEIDLYEIEFRQRIGRGVGGTTYLARWSGQEVAVKVSANTDLGLEGWYTEVHSLRRLHHPNVIRLLGSVYNPSPQTYGLVLEYCSSGDLSSALQRPTPPNFFWKVADDVANGMSYLHRKQILHRDIKPGNILLDGDVVGGNFTAKLTDFGVAILHQEGYVGEEHTAETGTYRWMSPEVIRHESYSLMTDVYSYAVVVWQLVTHEIPFQPLSQLEAAGRVAIQNARPLLPEGTPELVTALIERCWSKYPDERIPFAQITIELKEIHKVLSEKDKDWLRSASGHPVYDLSAYQPEFTRRRTSSESSRDSKDSRRSKSSKSSKRSTTDEKARRRKSGTGKTPDRSSGKRTSSNGIFSLFKK